MADPGRGLDAIVIGEYARAFYGGQYPAMAPLFEHYGIQLWAPEVGGAIDFQAERHEQMMLTLGWQSKREITRTKIRVRTAMATQPETRAATSAVGHRTGTVWRMRARTRTRRTQRGDGGLTAWNPIRTVRRSARSPAPRKPRH
jgi:hypothetical protein